MTKLFVLPRGPVTLAPATAALLGRLAAALGRPAAVTVDPALVEAAEAALLTAIPFDVLRARRRGPLPGRARRVDRGDPRLYRTSQPSVEFAHVAFAQLVGTYDDWTAEPCFAAFARTTDRARTRLVRWDVRKPGPDGQPYSLAQYLAEHHERTLPTDAPPLTLSIEPPPVVERYATDAKFGRGRVLLRAEGKSRIEFADGVRTLADSFLTFE